MTPHLLMTCDAVHQNGCQGVLEADSVHCPRCGRLAGHVAWDRGESEASEVHFLLTSRPGETRCAKSVSLLNRGPARVTAEVRLEDPVPGLRLLTPTRVVPGGTPERPGQAPVKIEWEPNSDPGQAALRLTTWDGPREDALWDPQPPRDAGALLVSWTRQGAAQMWVCHPVLVFHGELEEQRRELRIRNSGLSPLRLRLPEMPPGFSLEVPPSGQTVVPAQGELCLAVRCGLERPYGDTSASFVLRSEEGQEAEVCLRTLAEPGGFFQPDWLIALDFGTSSTSVVARRRLPDGMLSDEVLAVPGPLDPTQGGEEGSDRFPSALCQYRGQWYFAWEALEVARQHDADPEPWRPRLFHEETSLKRNLHREEEPFVRNEVADAELRLDRLAYRYFDWLRQAVLEPFLSRHSSGEPFVQYVISLPVLDQEGGPMYERQKRRTLEAASQAFGVPPTAIRVAYEPECAALYFLLGRGGGAGRPLPFSEGDGLCVFDSGGGTTDVVFGRLVLLQGRLTLQVERNLGLTHAGSTFGGADVTHYLHRELNSADYSLFHQPCELVPPTLEESEADPPQARGDITCLMARLDHLDRLKRRHLAEAVDADRLQAGLEAAPGLVEAYGRTQSDELVQVTARRVESVLVEIDRQLGSVYQQVVPGGTWETEGAALPRWVIPVGGNTLVPRVERWCLSLGCAGQSDRLAPVSPADRFLAVARGAAYALDVPLLGRAPYSLQVRVRLRDGSEQVLLTLDRFQSLRRAAQQRHVTAVGGAEVRVIGEESGPRPAEPWTLFQTPVEGPVTVSARLVGSRLRIAARSGDEAPERGLLDLPI